MWGDSADPAGLAALLDGRPSVRWVQLPWAGVEPYVPVIRAHADRTWTCAKGIYAEPVAEHALALALAGMRGLGAYARAGRWTGQRGTNLLGARVTVLGGGGIARSFLRLLGPFGADVTVVRSSGGGPVEGATRVVGDDATDDALRGAQLVVLALALTPATRGVIDARRLALLAPGACLVNVARGEHVVTDDVVAALRDPAAPLAFAGLDVTDPEPLPDGHPLWALEGAPGHPAHRQHRGDGGPPARRAGQRQRAPLGRRHPAPLPRRPRQGLLTFWFGSAPNGRRAGCRARPCDGGGGW